MAISSSSEVSLCSKTCIDSDNTLKTLCDEQMNQLGDQEAQILAYSQAVKKLEAQLVTFQKQQLSLNEKLTFQANEIYEKDEKLKKYRRIGIKAVKENEQLQKTLDLWKDSSKNQDSTGSIGTSSVHSVDFESEISRVPQEVYVSKPITTNEKGEGYSFTKKKCFVCGSLSHLIKDYDYYEKKMAREAAPKKQRVFNTGNRVTKPWNNADRINHANHFVPRLVILNSGRPNVNSVRPNVNTVRTNINSVRQNVNSVWSNVNTGSFNVNSVRPKQPVPTSTSPNFSSERTQDYPLKNIVDRGIFDSGCSRYMTGNKGQLEYFEEFNGDLLPLELNHRVKIIRSDNDTEFKNRDMLEFCGNKGIKQEYSNARTPQQNGVAERKNRTLIEAARTMLADSLLPTTFWAEAVSTACYVLNRVRVTKPQNKTPYELLFGQKPIISYIRPFGCHVTILDTLSVLGKFDGKSDEGFLVGYSLNSKAYRVYNLVTKRVEVNLHVNFLEDKPNVKGVGYRWMFDIDYLTDSMNYIPVSLENQANPHAGTSEVTNSAGTSQTPNANASEEKDEDAELIVVPSAVKNTAEKVETRKSSTNSKKEEILTEPQQEKEASSTGTSEDNPKILAFRRELEAIAQKHLGTVPENNSTSTPSVNSGSEPVNTGELDPNDSAMPELKIFHKSETGIFDEASYDEEGVVTDFNSLPTEIEVSPTPTFRIHNIHPKSQILGDPKSAVQTRSKVQQKLGAHALISYIQKQQRNNHKDQHHCLFACFLSQEEPTKIYDALQDDS
ncbi:ribonuclease H-like domain-containing protein [Tanacetum coccineum]